MSLGLKAAQAYAATAAVRSHREQEAELFVRVGVRLRQAPEASELARSRALADNQRLWAMVIDMLQDPGNTLPTQLRADIISVGLCVQREMCKPEPDFAFLAGVNENIAAGLAAGA